MEYIEYQTKEGDRWDLIAWEMYEDPMMYPVIALANPTVTLDPILAGGITLKVPILQQAELVVMEVFAPWDE